MVFFKSVILICASLLAFNAAARTPVPIIDYNQIVVVTTSGKALQAADVKQAITLAGIPQKWTIKNNADGSLLATLVVRNKHTIVVKIDYNEKDYSIHYSDSNNMKYEISRAQATLAQVPADHSQDGQPLIHPFYNKWVKTFKDNIGLELLRL